MEETPRSHRHHPGSSDGDDAGASNAVQRKGDSGQEATEHAPIDSDTRGPLLSLDRSVSVQTGNRPSRVRQRERIPASCYEEGDGRRSIPLPCYEEGDGQHSIPAPCYEEGSRCAAALPCYEEGDDRHMPSNGTRRRRKRARVSSSSGERATQHHLKRFGRSKRRRSRSKSIILDNSKPVERESRGRDRSLERYRRRTDYFCDHSLSRSTKRRSRSTTRQPRKRDGSEGAHGRQSRKRYCRMPKRSRDDSEDSEIRWRSRACQHSNPSSPLAFRKRHTPGEKVRRRYKQSSDSDERSYYNRKRHYSRSPRECPRKQSKLDGTNVMLDKVLRIIKDVKGSSSKLSLSNVVPEFDPMNKDQTILTWLTKVEECAEIYRWDDKETVHFALPKLCGIAKSWYTGLDTILYTWNEWKKKLIESFPCRDDYAELLTIMLGKKVRFGESLERYFYEKINLLNRCGIKGRKAVDCLLNGVEDRAVRVGAQAVQFREPEEVLKYFKTIKVTNDRRDKTKYDRKPFVSDTSSKKSSLPRKLVCFNCDEEGHIAPKCPKQRTTCTTCKKIGHLSNYCDIINKTQNKSKNQKDLINKETKEVAALTTSGNSNEKYVFEVMVNGVKLMCHVDLGSQCTLIRQSDAKRLDLEACVDAMPLMRGIGGHYVEPLGRCRADVTVQGIKENIEMFIVEDSVIKYPVLLGHSFTEKPYITITKTSDEIIFDKAESHKVSIRMENNITLSSRELQVIPVETEVKYTGPIYVNGSVRGAERKEYFLFPGEYKVRDGTGRIMILNMSDETITICKGELITRATILPSSLDVSMVTFEQNQLDDDFRCGPQLVDSERTRLRSLLSEFKDCFSSGLKDLGFTTASEMVIQLDNVEPVVYRPYRLSYGERTLVRDMVKEMLDAGIIKESCSPYASPIVLVKKKTGEKRLCVDYRALNKRTKKDHYPSPLIEDQLDRLAGNNLFISLDLASGYYQIPISKESQDKTAFVTPDGQYEYTRMPFGLVNAPSVFQRTMNKILLEAKIKYALVYMDDILIPAHSFDEGLTRLEEVLSLLRKGGLTLKLAKCNFFFEEIDFLGFEVSAKGIKPGLRKIEAVTKFPTPTNVHEVRQFYGLASFFRRFVQGFAIIAKPLSDLLCKDREWKWGTEQKHSFESLKAALTSRPILSLYDPARETVLHTDASKHGVAGILLQRCESGLLRPVSYFSRKTTPAEEKMHSFDLETLAVVASLARFRTYLLGVPFKVYTDCNALRTTLSKRDLIPRIARWWIQLQEFDCEIEYRPGSRMAHADALSRNPVGDAQAEEHVLDVLALNEEDWIVTVQSSDDEITRIKLILSDPESENVADIIKNYKLKNGKVYRIIEGEGNNMRWVVPKGARWQVVKMNHDDIGHFGYEKTLKRIQQSFWFRKMRSFVKKYVQSCLECAHHKGITGKQHGQLHPIPKVEVPFHTVHADHLGPFVRSARGNTYILVIIDGFTKFINISAVRNTKTVSTLKIFREHISYFGAPTRLITDQGTSFTSNSFRAFTKSLGIKHILNAVATPRANGQVERFNRTILDALSTKTHGKDDKSWDEYIPDIQIGLNTTIHKTTGKSPSELLFGFKLKSSSENILSEVIDETLESDTPNNLDEVRSEAGQRIRDQQIKDKKTFDAKRNLNKSFEAGDLVSVRREVPSDGKSKKLTIKYQGPYRIIKVLPNERYLVEDTPLTRKNGSRRYENVIAIDKLKPWLCFNKDFDSSSESNDSEKE